MTRKDYISIAQAVRASWEEAYKGTDYPIDNGVVDNSFIVLVDKLCGTLKRDNPRFDRDRFVDACSPEGVRL